MARDAARRRRMPIRRDTLGAVNPSISADLSALGQGRDSQDVG
jgi:hypothetical protein